MKLEVHFDKLPENGDLEKMFEFSRDKPSPVFVVLSPWRVVSAKRPDAVPVVFLVRSHVELAPLVKSQLPPLGFLPKSKPNPLEVLPKSNALLIVFPKSNGPLGIRSKKPLNGGFETGLTSGNVSGGGLTVIRSRKTGAGRGAVW